jgi:mannose-6-phosphate isomerase-like protein (cupin superfamily)
MDYRDDNTANQQTWIEEGEMIIVPRGVEHCPVAEEECHVLLFEPMSTLNTGNVRDGFTKEALEAI